MKNQGNQNSEPQFEKEFIIQGNMGTSGEELITRMEEKGISVGKETTTAIGFSRVEKSTDVTIRLFTLATFLSYFGLEVTRGRRSGRYYCYGERTLRRVHSYDLDFLEGYESPYVALAYPFPITEPRCIHIVSASFETGADQDEIEYIRITSYKRGLDMSVVKIDSPENMLSTLRYYPVLFALAKRNDTRSEHLQNQ
ncbi:MAG: hypothetical protein UY50_C0015G0007 [Parcubacteria group bacterium GW2011_GWA2_49_9]|nr:MAG: hypothetical protein UY50_C0015G0007 [Parcubacteria group bacterium GW2011_GWA2_49_9]